MSVVETGSKERQFGLLSTEQFLHYWPEILPNLKAVPYFLEYCTVEWVLEQTLKGHLQFWALSDGSVRGIIMTRVQVTPAQRVLQLTLAFGNDFEEYIELAETTLFRFAQMMECTRMELIGRKGWRRKLRRFNPDFCYEVLSKAVSTRGRDQ